MSNKRAQSKQPALPKVGDLVQFTWSVSEWTGQVIDYIGPVGVNGEHIFAVRFPLTDNGEGEEKYAELAAGRLSVIKKAA